MRALAMAMAMAMAMANKGAMLRQDSDSFWFLLPQARKALLRVLQALNLQASDTDWHGPLSDVEYRGPCGIALRLSWHF
jgi:hypothetical protein